MNKSRIKQNANTYNGYTLIELLATVVILALVATIAVPIVLNITSKSRKEAFKIGVFSLYDAYKYEESSQNYDDMGRLDISDLKLTNERYSIGKVERNDEEKLEVINVSDGVYCANGTRDDLEITDGDCSNLDETAPEISNVAVETTTRSVNVIVSFSEPDSLIKSYEFRLFDNGGNIVVDWVKGDSLTGSGLKRITSKKFDNLTQDTTYKVEIRITNTSGNINDTVTREEIVKTNKINNPVISYDTSRYSYNKDVTISYDTPSELVNSYKIIDNDLNTVVDWTIADSLETTITIDNYNYTVLARSSNGIMNFDSSSLIGYIDFTGPDVTVTEVSSNWATSDDITLNLTDNLSGVENYCISSNDNSETCEWTNIANSLNTSISKTILVNGDYYAFAKDNVGNISQSFHFTISKVDRGVPEIPTITASDMKDSNTWHDNDFTLSFSGSSSLSGIRYYYGTSLDLTNMTQADSFRAELNTLGTTYYVIACNGVNVCSNTYESNRYATYIIKLDKLIPTVPTITPSDSILSSNWHTSNFNLNFSGSTSISNIHYEYVSTETAAASGSSVLIARETASDTYYVKACNEVSRCSDEVSYVAKLDKTSPTSVYATIAGTTTKSISVQASGTDTISGIKKYEFSKDNGATWQVNSNEATNTYTYDNLTTNSYDIKVRVTNNAGLSRISDKIVGTTLAMTRPEIVVNTPDWAVSKVVTITYPAGFTNYYKIDNGSWTNANSITKELTITTTGTEVYARSYDGVNYSASASLIVNKIDTVVPVVNITGVQNATNRMLTANVTSGTSTSGYTYQWYKDGSVISGATSNTYAATTGGVFTVKVNTVARNNSGVTPVTSAGYTINSYAITYNNNGGSGSPANQTKVEGISLNLSSTTPTRSGYTFLGWGTSASDTSVDYNPSATIITNTGLDLYAIWRKQITIAFNGNGATVGSTSGTCYMYNADTGCSITSPTITRSGFTILGYNTSNGGTASNWNQSTAKNVSANTTYYAITSKGVTVTFNKNGAGSQTTSDGTASTGASVTRSCTIWNSATTCSVTSPVIAGSSATPSVLGYNTSSTTSSTWSANTAKSFNSNATYYAITRKNAVTLTGTFNVRTGVSKSGGTASCTLVATYNGAAQATSCNVTTPTLSASSGYTALGWSTNSSATTKTWGNAASVALTANTQFYSVSYKNAITYTITFNANGATLSYGSQSCTIDAKYNGASQATTCSITSPTITRTQYDVIGFNTSSNATTSTWNQNTTKSVSGSATYYAITKPSYICASGTLTYNASYSASTGGYICVANNPSSSCNYCSYSVSTYGTDSSCGYSTCNSCSGSCSACGYATCNSCSGSCSACGYKTCNSCSGACAACGYKSCSRTETYAATTTYTCPSGYSASGSGSSTTCTATTSHNSSPSGCYRWETTYHHACAVTSCSWSCSSTNSMKFDCSTVYQSYSCPIGYTLYGTTCYDANCYADCKTNPTKCGCPSTSSTCNKYVDCLYCLEYDYSCPSGYSKSGSGNNTKCTKTASATEEDTCPNGGSLNGKTCSKTVTSVHESCGYATCDKCSGECAACGYKTCSKCSGECAACGYKTCNSCSGACSTCGYASCSYNTTTWDYNCEKCGTSYSCPSGWSSYSGSGSSMYCYKAATRP